MNASIVTTMLRALLRWWWLIALAISLGVGVGYLLRSEQVELFAAESTVTIDPNTAQVGSNNNNYASGLLDLYVVLLTRDSMLQPVIDDLNLDVTTDQLRDRVTLEPIPQALLLSIRVIDTDPERAATIANRMSDELIAQTSDRSTLLDRQFILSQIDGLQKQITDLQRQHDALVERHETLTSAFEINQNLQERAVIEQAIQNLRGLLLDLVQNAPESEVSPFEPAVPNYIPITSNSFMDLVIAGIAGGMLAVITIMLFTFFDDRLQWEEGRLDTTLLNLKILGPLGIVPGHKLPLYVDTMPESVEAEALRQLRAKIVLAAGGAHPRVLTVLSHDTHEGKTLTTANLALENAHSGMRTLALDGDMRRGDLHEVFQLPNLFGLSDILQSNQPLTNLLPDAILDSGHENLAVLPAGRAAADPAALLGRARFTELIELLSHHFDAIIMDAAPTIGGPDAVFLGEASDGVVIVINTRRTRLASLKRTVEELQSGPKVNIYGLVFNRVRLQVTSKYNNTYYRQSSGLLSAERVSREMARPGTGVFAFRRHIITDRQGEKLFSITACAARLGVKKQTVRNWISSGYIKTERHFLRQWVRESTINDLVQQRMMSATTLTEAGSAPQAISTANGNQEVPAHLSNQREAILGFANRPNTDPETS